MTEAEKYAMRLIFPRHIADKYIAYGKSINDIDPIELKHAQMRREAEERKAKEISEKEKQEIFREELQKALQKWLNK